jgi:hypothetical protein
MPIWSIYSAMTAVGSILIHAIFPELLNAPGMRTRLSGSADILLFQYCQFIRNIGCMIIEYQCAFCITFDLFQKLPVFQDGIIASWFEVIYCIDQFSGSHVAGNLDPGDFVHSPFFYVQSKKTTRQSHHFQRSVVFIAVKE